MSLADPLLWTAVLKIVGVNLILSGDNAVVIALAARSLPPRQQKLAIRWGAGAAVLLRVVLTVFAVALLELPWLKLAGGVLLVWVGVKLLIPTHGEGALSASGNLASAVRTILVADVVMSLDNVLGVAAAAGGEWVLLAFGLALSVPLVVFGATLLVKLMERVPSVVIVGAALIGYVAGEMAWEDSGIESWTGLFPDAAQYVVASASAAVVVAAGLWLARRSTRKAAAARHPAR